MALFLFRDGLAMEIVDFLPEFLRLQDPHHRPELGEVDHRGEVERNEWNEASIEQTEGALFKGADWIRSQYRSV
jgi:hypothetical protein